MNTLSPGYVFISYARSNLGTRQRIIDSLRERGISVWVDTENLMPGTPNWERAIENGIKGCGAVVVLLSPDASQSEWVLREVIYADVHQKRILPVLIDGDDKSSVPFHLISYQRVHLTKGTDWNLGIQQLVGALSEYSRIEVERMRIAAEVAAQEEAARQATIRAAQEKAAQEAAERVVREKSERSRDEINRDAAVRVAQEEAKRKAAEKVAQEEAKRRAEEAARRKAAEELARQDWVTSDDKLWALLTYILTPLMPIFILLMEDKKTRPFIKAHNAQALVWGIFSSVVNLILGVFLIGLITAPITFVISIYWGIQAYNGKLVEIPVITNFVKQQGWS